MIDPSKMNPREQAQYLERKLGYEVFAPPPKKWLDTGSPRFNRVLGSEEKGLAFGKTYTLAGKPSSGKTLTGTFIQGLAQTRCGAKLFVVDIEDSCDPRWMRTQGCNTGKIYKDGTCDNVAIFRPRLALFGKRKKKADPEIRMQCAEELFDLVEKWMIMQRQYDENCLLCGVVDSTTAVEPLEELEAGLAGQNMRTKMLAPFLNRLTKRWNKVAANTNALIIYIAQLRTNPGQMFGNPEYIPGGAGVLYYPSSINKVKRAPKGGLIYGPAGEPTGVASVITNIKNKVGGGSIEGARCGFRASFNELNWQFMPPKKLEGLLKGQKGDSA